MLSLQPVSPAEMTWCAGVDVLSFGATRNGTWTGDAVIFFDPERAQVFDRLASRSSHRPDKSDVIGAQLVAILDDGVWLLCLYRQYDGGSVNYRSSVSPICPDSFSC